VLWAVQGSKAPLSALTFCGWVSVVRPVDQVKIRIPGLYLAARAGKSIDGQVWSRRKSARVAERFLDGDVVNFTVNELVLTPGANKDPLGHMSASPSAGPYDARKIAKTPVPSHKIDMF
jgi:hypothetical protein